MANLGGRPREWDRDKLAEMIIEWVQLDDSTNLNGFTAYSGVIPTNISKYAKEHDGFRQAYEYAKGIIADRREKKLAKGEVHVKAYDLNARVYDFYTDEKHKEIAAEGKQAVDDRSEKVDQLLDLMKSQNKS